MSKEDWLAQKKERDRQKNAEESDTTEKEGAAKATVKTASPPPQPPSKTPVAKPQPRNDGEKTSPLSQSRAKPSRLRDVAEWKPDDYDRAKRENDPRLVAAVVRLGERCAGNESDAELLTKLLELPTDPSPAINTKLTQAIVAALVVNGTSRAHQTLESLIAGTLKTADPQIAIATAVDKLSEYSSAENENLLFRFLTAPSKTMGKDRSAIEAERLRKTMVAKMASTASESFRVRLATHMIAPDTSQQQYDQLWACLKETRIENIAPQIILYGSDSLEPAVQRLLEKQFAVWSGSAMRLLLGIRPSRSRSANNPETVDAKDSYRVVKECWGSDLTVAVERRLRILDSLENSAGLAMLAGTMPNPSVRTALLRALEKHWDEGPRSLELLYGSNGATVEPGLLTVVKMLPRKDTTAFRSPTSSREDGKLPVAINKNDEKWWKEQTSQQWMDFSKNIVRLLCQQFHEAARGDLNVEEDYFSFKLHPRAEVVAAYQLNWPADLGEKAIVASALQVRYVRAEQRVQPKKVLAYYRRQLPNAKEHPIPNGMWLDSFTQDREANSVCSTDVLLTIAKTTTTVRSLPDQEQLLVVEILRVECDTMDEGTSLSAHKK
jgi:hypothetical protein